MYSSECSHDKHVPTSKDIDKKHIFKVYDPTFTNTNDMRLCHCGGSFNKNYERLHLKTKTHEEWVMFISVINKVDNIPTVDINYDGIIKYKYFTEDGIIKRMLLNKPELLPVSWDCAKNTIEILLISFENTNNQHIKLFSIHRACTVSALHMLRSKYYMRLYIRVAKIYKEMCIGLF
jgi:hypothetical protein